MTDRTPLIYIAAPYADRNPQVIQQRIRFVTSYTAHLLARGVNAFSPLTYTHRIQELGYRPAPPGDWYSFDLQFLAQCESIHILTLPGWEHSRGVALEVLKARRWALDIAFVDPEAAGGRENLLSPLGIPGAGTPRTPLCYADPPTPLLTYIHPSADAHPEHTAGQLIAAGVAAFCPRSYRNRFQQNGLPQPTESQWQAFERQMRLRCQQELHTNQ